MSQRPRSPRRPPRATKPIGEDHAFPDWVDVGGRRMFVVDYTSAGFPFGVFEDEMEDETNGETKGAIDGGCSGDPDTWASGEFF